MRFHRRQKPIRKVLHSWPMIAILFIITVVSIYNVVGLIKKDQAVREDRRIAALQFDSLQSRQSELARELEELETDQGIEEQLRNKFGVVKEGEGVIVIVDDPEDEEADDNLRKKSGFLQFLKNIFSKN